MQQLKNELWLILMKVWIWGVLIFIGIIAKFSYDVSIKKKYTFATFLSTLGIAVFVGYLASVYCAYRDWTDASKLIVPIATVASERIIEIIVANAHKWAKKLFPEDEENE